MVDTIAYIVKGFPRLSETFISNEVLLLEKLGVNIKLFSIKQPDETLLQSTVSRIKTQVEYLPAVTSLSNTFLMKWLLENMPHYVKAHLQLASNYPVGYFQTLAEAITMSIIYRNGLFTKPRKIFIKEFIQAVFIADQINNLQSIRHIHAHFCHGATTIALMVSKITGLPFSFTAHAKDIYQKNQNPGNLLKNKINASAFVATCTGANKKYLDKLGEADKIKLIYHGLDTQFFIPFTQRSSDTRLQILSVGRFVEKKGFHFLVQACAILKNKDFKFNCRIIGEHGDSYQRLQETIKQLELEQYISLEPPKAHDELLKIYQQSHIFALPCQIVNDGDRDGIPNVLVEAMACGLAVVSTGISGIPELVKHRHNGLLVAEKNSQDLANAIELLMIDQGLSESLAINARTTVLQEFDSAQTTLQLKRLFDECMEHNPVLVSENEEVTSA